MKNSYTILLLLGFLNNLFIAQAQKIERYNTFSYNVNEGLLQSTIADIAIDQNNFCWISFPKGIQKFDGKNFITVPVQPGLPDDKFVFFLRSSNGDLLLSHSQGISKYTINNNRFVLVHRKNTFVKYPDKFIGEDENIIYFFSESGEITGLDNKEYKTVTVTKTGIPNYAYNNINQTKISSNIINHKIAIQINSSLYLWDLQKNKLVSRSDSIPTMSQNFLYLKTENEVLFYTYKINNAFQLYNFTTHNTTLLPIKGKSDQAIYRCIIYPWQNKTLLSFDNELYETDSTLQVLKSGLVNFQNQPVTGGLSISSIKEDNFGNIYLQTVTGGIKKIIRNNYPIKYFGTEKTEGNNVLSILPDKKNNRILVGGNGLLIFDTLQHLIKHIKILPGKTKSFSPNNIIKDNNGNYILFNTGEKNAWRLSKNLTQINPIAITSSLPYYKRGIDYFGNFLFNNDKGAVVQSQSRLYKINFAGNTVEEHEFTNSYTMGGLLYNSFIISHANDELIFLDAITFKEIKKIPFKNTGHVRCFAKPTTAGAGEMPNTIHIGSNNGIFIIDSIGKIAAHLTKENGLPDNCIYAMLFDDNNDLWCSTNKGIFRLNKDRSIFQLKKEDGLQENEFNTNVAAKSIDGELFFGGVNGVSSFYPSALNPVEEKLNLFFTGIKVNNADNFKDSAAWSISNIRLAHDKNTVAFDFIAMGSSNPEQYVYQYKMEGVDNDWIQNKDMQTVRYSLQPGKYSFKIYASRFFDKDAKPMKEIAITIHPPFYKTWWFITGAGLLFVAGLFYSINRYNKNEYNKKLTDIENEYKIQVERERISRDLHDSIGAYANAVLYKTELLETENNIDERTELMQDLKFASKDIITSLRETVWALKKDSYTGEDCLVRIRNFIQPLSRYYKNINFKISGDVPADLNFHYTRALSLVRIIQEAVSNSIKHADAKNIYVNSSNENGKWKLTAEDDGMGFDYETVKKLETGNGLNNMQRRAADAGFIFNIESEAGKPTVISVIA